MVQEIPADGLLAVSVPAVGIATVLIRDFRKAAALFLVFCLLMAAAWIRLKLPWLGAVEVAIGALMPGWMVRHALDLLPGFPGPDTNVPEGVSSRPAGLVFSLAGSMVFCIVLAAAAICFFRNGPLSRYAIYAASGIPAAGAAQTVMLSGLKGWIAHDPQGLLPAYVLWLGFAVKAGVAGLHVWLPMAHPVAPSPANAVLSGAMIKAGFLGWLFTLPAEPCTCPSRDIQLLQPAWQALSALPYTGRFIGIQRWCWHIRV